MPNQLIKSTSPYLLQHANNPVDWHEWNAETLNKAKAQNKPIFLSIGYAACHWCHVMEHESFEDEATAELMNAHFINIKVDREQRPDLDSIYMAATLALTGSGGWPMSVFLTPDLKPFYAGTYFPPEPRYNMPSFKDLLTGIANAYQNENGEVQRVAEQVTSHLHRQAQVTAGSSQLSQPALNASAQRLYEDYDWGFGGWGQAPKFPQAMTVELLFRQHISGDEKALPPALHALQAMARGGMYDVVGGGFSRYSVDNHWLVPHFEKMLYDNALLARAYLSAYQITGESFYKRIVEETLTFTLRELTHPQGGFFASLDADSEGVEGKFYVWEASEIEALLGADYALFKAAYGIKESGNWEGHTVLQRALDDKTLAAKSGLTPAALTDKLNTCHSKLLAERAKRVRPATDDKVITAWNGLMLSAFAVAARTLTSPEGGLHEVYYPAAVKNAEFLINALRPNGQLRRAWRDGQTSGEVFLDDYAALILGLLDLYETDFNANWFSQARQLADEMIEQFADPQGGFFDTSSQSEALLMRPKDLQDNATPSGNALAAEALLRLAAFSEQAEYRRMAEQAFALSAEQALRYPTAFARWLCAIHFALAKVQQVAISGELSDPAVQALIAEARKGFQPHRILAVAPPPAQVPELLKNRPLIKNKPAAYVCEGFVCQLPVGDVGELRKILY